METKKKISIDEKILLENEIKIARRNYRSAYESWQKLANRVANPDESGEENMDWERKRRGLHEEKMTIQGQLAILENNYISKFGKEEFNKIQE